MRRRVVFFMLFSLAACSQQPTAVPATLPPTADPTPTAAPTTPAGNDRSQSALDLINAFAANDWTTAESQFDTTMARELPAEKLAELWTGLQTQLGEFKAAGAPAVGTEGGYDTVDVPLEFARDSVLAHVVFNAEGNVAGLFFRPVEKTSAPSSDLPTYIDPNAFTAEPITVGAGTDWPLDGTLSLPNGTGPFPAVVLIHGSGPSDQDETIGPNKPFRDLAGGLASQNIAVLRFDKRTLTYGAQTGLLKDFTVQQESIDDALAAVALLRADPRIDPQRIFVLGHSLGGALIPRIGAADAELAGLIVLAGPTTPLEDLILEQYTYIFNLDGSIDGNEQAQLDALAPQIANIKDPALTADSTANLFGAPASYWLDLRGYDPALAARDLPQPLLILQGARDYQVPPRDFAHWQEQLSGKAEASFKQYPGLNHLFMPGEGPSQPEEYQRPNNVDGAVITDIAAFVQAH